MKKSIVTIRMVGGPLDGCDVPQHPALRVGNRYLIPRFGGGHEAYTIKMLPVDGQQIAEYTPNDATS
jgi:hypothetical protein